MSSFTGPLYSDIVASYNGGPYANVAVTSKVYIASGSGSTSVGARWGDYSGGIPQAGYNAELLSGGLVKLWRISDWTQLGTYQVAGYSNGTWYTLTLRADGTALSVQVNGVTRITASDSAFTTGEAGVWSYASTAVSQHRFDDFVIQVLGGGHAPGGRLYAPEQGTGLFARLSGLIRDVADRIRNVPLAAPMKSRLSAPPVGQMWKTYYFAGSQRVAMRVLTGSSDTLYYLHADHLGSTSLTTCGSGGCGAAGGEVARQTYYPFGQIRTSTGSMPTDVGYTGQRLDATGLMHYGARYYDPYLNRWISPDTIVPDPKNPQQLNRLAYVLNNPIKHTDPTGHCIPGETCRAPKPPARPPQGPPQPPPPQPPQPQQAPTVGGWTLMLREMNKSIVGAELLGLIPDDTAFGWSPFVSKGRMAQFYGHLVVAPHGFDPASSLDPASVGVLSHELTHVLQRIVHRDGMCDNCTTLYSETEANIIGWTIKYDLTTDQNERQLIKGNLQFATGPLAPMYDWLRQQGFPYDRSGEWTFGTGDWRDTLPQLGFSQATVQHIVDIINQP